MRGGRDAVVSLAYDPLEGVVWNVATGMMKRALVQAAVMALACAVAAVWSYRTGRESGAAQVQAKWDAEKAAQARAVIAAIEARDRATATMAARTEALRKEYRRDIARIAADRDRLLDSLRDRPERPASGAGLPDTAAAGTGCTGAGLARPDAEFLARYAADASRLQSALNVCVRQYNSMMESINVVR